METEAVAEPPNHPFMKRLLNAILWCWLLAAAGGCATSQPARFERADFSKPGFFPIMPWDPYHGWGQPLIEGRKNGLESIAQCNFNLAGFVLPKDLPLCRKLGLGAIMLPTDPTFTNIQYLFDWRKLSDAEIDRRVKSMVSAAGSSPAIMGYFITDEPAVQDFPALAKAVAAVRKYAPGKLAYINLLADQYARPGPSGAPQLGTTNYTEYLERFVTEVKPQLLTYDNYAVQHSGDLQQDPWMIASYYHNLLEIRRVAQQHYLPYLNIVASGQLGPGKYIPTPANLLFQAYTTLAAGYRGVTWYTYFGDGYLYAPLAKSGDKNLTWNYLQEVNRQVTTLAPLMSQLTSTGVFFSKPAPVDNLPLLSGNFVRSVECLTPVMVGEFKAQNGECYAMVVNLSLERSARFKLRTTGSAQIGVVSAADGRLSPFDSNHSLWLPAGQGVLLMLGRL